MLIKLLPLRSEKSGAVVNDYTAAPVYFSDIQMGHMNG